MRTAIRRTAAAAGAPTVPREFEAGKVYPLDTFMGLAGMGRNAMRQARKRGLKVRRVGRNGYVSGSDFIAFLEANGEADPPAATR